MQMLAAVESVGDSESQIKSQFAVCESASLELLPSVGQPPVERVGDSEGHSQSLLAIIESMPAGACGPYQASSCANLAEKQKKC